MINFYDKASVIMEPPEKLTASGRRHLKDQAAFIGDKALGLLVSRIYLSRNPLASAGELSKLIEKFCGTDNFGEMCDKFGLSNIARIESCSTRVKAEYFEAYYGYVIMSEGFNDGIRRMYADLEVTMEEKFLELNEQTKFSGKLF